MFLFLHLFWRKVLLHMLIWVGRYLLLGFKILTPSSFGLLDLCWEVCYSSNEFSFYIFFSFYQSASKIWGFCWIFSNLIRIGLGELLFFIIVVWYSGRLAYSSVEFFSYWEIFCYYFCKYINISTCVIFWLISNSNSLSISLCSVI